MTGKEKEYYDKMIIENLQREVDIYLAEQKERKFYIIVISVCFAISVFISAAILLLPKIFP